MALTVLEGGRDHQQPPGPPPAQPTALLVPSLYPYQAAGFGWMLRQEGVNAVAGADRYVLGGLLADEQGMGKTVQTLSLCLAHPPPLHAAPVGGSLSCAGGGSRAALGTLIVCPLNLLRQWQREIGTKAAPPYGGNVCVHHGSGRTRVAAQLASFDFVLTTYSVVRSEMAGKRARPGGSSSSAQGSSSGGSGAAQQGGGGGAQGGGGGAQGALFGLKWWRVVLDEAHSIRNGSAGISQACCALRATHRWCLTGTPLQNSAQDVYPLLRFLRYPEFGESLSAFKPLLERGGGAQKLQAVLASVMLRRLKSDTFEGRPILELPAKTIEVVARPFGEAEQRVYAALERSARLEFQTILDDGAVQANYLHVLALLTRLRQACDSTHLVQAAYERAAKAEAAAAASEAASGRPPTAAALSKVAAMMEPGGAEDCSICMETILREAGAVTACGHAYCLDCIGEHVQRGDPHADDGAARCPLCRTAVRQADLFRWRCLPPHPPAPPSPYADAAEEEGAAAAAAVEVSTKMQMTLEAVREATAGGEKVLIFSCYTQFLDLLQRMLSHEQIACGRVDGTQTAEQRDAQVMRFHEPGVPVLLMSLKCGVGLNLTCASTVIMCEPWWNPFAEEQACDRVHRIGQRREVRVLRLAVPGTVEDRIMQLQQKKREVAALILGDDARPEQDAAGRAAGRLSETDLAQLFGF